MPDLTAHDGVPQPSAPARVIPTLLVMALGLLVSWGVIFSGNMLGRGAADDLNYHWVAINQFAAQLPSPDITDYASATTPGYHLLLAPLVAQGLGHTGTQLVASLWTLALWGVMGWVLSARFGYGALILASPLITSIYVLFPGVWLLPDNAGWLLVLLVLLLALRPRQGWGVWALAGLLLAALVSLRQVHVWVAAVVWLSAWLGSGEQAPILRTFFSSFSSRAGRACIAGACTVPCFALLAWFLLIWGGLVPPMFQGMHQGPNPATPGFILTQLAGISVFFGPVLLPRLLMLWATRRAWLLAALLVGLVMGTIPASSYSYDAGRYGGIWNIMGQLPVIMDRSPFYVLGAAGGAIALTLWLSLAPRRDAWVWGGALLAFTLAQTANHASWQRYHEPMLLMMVLLILAKTGLGDSQRRWAVRGAIVLAMLLGAVTLNEMRTAQPVKPPTDRGPLS